MERNSNTQENAIKLMLQDTAALSKGSPGKTMMLELLLCFLFYQAECLLSPPHGLTVNRLLFCYYSVLVPALYRR